MVELREKKSMVCKISRIVFGGPEGIRTLGLGVANAALSQLSYRPTGWEENMYQDVRRCQLFRQ